MPEALEVGIGGSEPVEVLDVRPGTLVVVDALLLVDEDDEDVSLNPGSEDDDVSAAAVVVDDVDFPVVDVDAASLVALVESVSSSVVLCEVTGDTNTAAKPNIIDFGRMVGNWLVKRLMSRSSCINCHQKAVGGSEWYETLGSVY